MLAVKINSSGNVLLTLQKRRQSASNPQLLPVLRSFICKVQHLSIKCVGKRFQVYTARRREKHVHPVLLYSADVTHLWHEHVTDRLECRWWPVVQLFSREVDTCWQCHPHRNFLQFYTSALHYKLHVHTTQTSTTTHVTNCTTDALSTSLHICQNITHNITNCILHKQHTSHNTIN